MLADLVDTLAGHSDVPLSLAVTPQTLDTLAIRSASTVDRSVLAGLTALGQGGHVEVLPQTYASVSLRGWEAVGLGSELARQLATGASVLTGVFGSSPAATTWVVNGALDSASLRLLVAGGARQFIVPDGELSALPPLARETTFALPTQLTGTGAGAQAVVYGADPGLTADFSNPGGPVLAATQLLAELAMIQLETPGLVRGVAVLPPPGWRVDPVFIDTLLAGLDGHPLLRPVTASGLFGAVQVAPLQRSLVAASGSVPSPSGASSSTPGSSGSSGTGSGGTGSGGTGSGGTASGFAGSASTVVPAPTDDVAAQLGADADAILAARRGLSGLAAVLPQDAQRVETLSRILLTSESSALTAAERHRLIAAVTGAVRQVTDPITLPRSSSITLTSTRGAIPLTVLSAPSLHAHVEMRLSSQRLIFHPFSPPEGTCRVPTPTSEVCDLTLNTQNTTIKVPVETRSSGVFPLDVSLWTPDGSQLIAQDRNTVRSTAVSGVGVVLIVLAIVSLGLWWIRDLRHGRRARQLLPAPHEESPVADESEVTEAAGVADESADQSGWSTTQVPWATSVPATTSAGWATWAIWAIWARSASRGTPTRWFDSSSPAPPPTSRIARQRPRQ